MSITTTITNIIEGEIRKIPHQQNYNTLIANDVDLQAQIDSNDVDIANRYTKSEVDAKDANLQTQINNDKTDLANHLSSLTAHDATEIINNSSVVGTKVSDALNTVQQQVNALVIGGTTNTTIGVYSLTATGSANAYIGTFASLTYFGGLKLNVTFNTKNTGASTFNLNSLGVKNIKILNANNVKQDLSGGELIGVKQLQYDGTDFILIQETLSNTTSTVSASLATPIVSVTDSYSGVCDVSVKGKTTVNGLGTLGKFGTDSNADGLADGWTNYASNTFSLVNGEQTFTPTAQFGRVNATNSIVVGRTFVSIGYVKSTDNTIRVTDDNQTVIASKANSGSGIFEKIGDLFTTTSTSLLFKIITFKPSAFTPITVKQAFYVDVTDYPELVGLTNQQKLNWCLANLEYCDGMDSARTVDVESVGKNLFDFSNVTTGYTVSTTGALIVDATSSASEYIKVKPSTIYYRNNTTNLAFYNENKDFLSYVTTNSFTTPATAFYLRVGVLNSALSTYQLEYGTTATQYEPFKNSILSATCTDPTKFALSKLPNGVENKLELTQGEWKATKNISGVVALNGSESWSQDSNLTNTMIFSIDISDSAKVDFSVVSDKFQTVTDSQWGQDLSEAIAHGNGNTRIWIRILKSKLTTQNVAGFKSWLTSNNVKIQYQLATPVIIPYEEFDYNGIYVNGLNQSFDSRTQFSLSSDTITPNVDIVYPLDVGASLQQLSDEIIRQREEIDDIYGYVPVKRDISCGIPQSVTIANATSVIPELTLNPTHLINTLGATGNCESITPFTASGCTLSLDTSKKVFGTNALKITLTATTGTVSIPVSSVFTPSNYQLFSAYLDRGNATNITLQKDATGGGTLRSVVSTAVTPTRSGFVTAPADNNAGNLIKIVVTGSIGQIAYVDGIMNNVISLSDYSDTVANLLIKYPYCDGIGVTKNPTVKITGKNLFDVNYNPIWGKYLLTDNNISSFTDSFYSFVSCKPNTTYTVRALSTNSSMFRLSLTSRDDNKNFLNGFYFSTPVTDRTITITTNSNAKYLCVSQLDFKQSDIQYLSIQLEEGTTATAYEPYRESIATIQGDFLTGDEISILNGETFGNKLWSSKKVLYGKDYAWVYDGDLTAFKTIRLLTQDVQSTNNASDYNKIISTKYDSKILQTGNFTDLTTKSDVVYCDANRFLKISIADTDTGFTETLNPNDDEVKAFMNGWKATANNGTRYTAWVSVVDGTTVPTSQTIDFVKSNLAPNYEGYQLYYKYATVKAIDDTSRSYLAPIKGDEMALLSGINSVTLIDGVVDGEYANTAITTDGTYAYINNTAYLQNKVESFGNVYVNGVTNSNWTFISSYGFRGNGYMRCPIASYNSSATYTVDYTILSSIAPQIGSGTLSYMEGLVETVNDLVQVVDGKQDKNVVFEEIIDKSIYESFVNMVENGRCVPFGTQEVRYYFTIPYSVEKIVKPNIKNFSVSDIRYFTAAGGVVDAVPIANTALGIVDIQKKFVTLRVSYDGSNSTIRTALLNNGISILGISVQIDCGGVF